MTHLFRKVDIANLVAQAVDAPWLSCLVDGSYTAITLAEYCPHREDDDDMTMLV
jgi:hypothetical protein